MKSVLIAIFGMFICAGAYAVPADVDYILDGDTFSARVALRDDTKITVRVRIINIDTPEMNGECDDERERAIVARDRLSELIPVGTTVELTNIKDDKYLGRIDARVFAPDGRDVGNVLVSEKLARRYSGGRRASWCK